MLNFSVFCKYISVVSIFVYLYIRTISGDGVSYRLGLSNLQVTCSSYILLILFFALFSWLMIPIEYKWVVLTLLYPFDPVPNISTTQGG